MTKTVPFKTSLFLLTAVMLIAAAAAYLWQLERTRLAPTPRSRVSIEIGAARLLVPTMLIRGADRRVDGPTARLDLALTFPEMEPLSAATVVDEHSSKPAAIFVALETADTGLDPSQRPKDLYARFLAPEVESGPGTLLRRIFKPASPYGGEYLEIAPPDGEVFAARCLLGASVETAAARCIWQFRYRDIDVQVRFSPDALPNWERLNDSVRQLVQRIYLES